MTVSYSETLVSSPIGAQGAYPQTLTKGHEGLIGDLQAYVSRSYTNETSAAIPFGHALIRDGAASGDGAKLPAGASATDILGIAVDSNTFEINADAKTADGRVGYPDKEMVNVYSKDAIALGDAVRLYHTDGASAASDGSYKGRFGKTAAAGKTFEVTAGARWLSACAAGGIALLEIDIPGLAVTADT